MHHWFLRGREVNPTGTALRVGSLALSYDETHRRAARWADALRHHRRTDRTFRIGILSGRNEVRYIGLLAALYAGATAVPVNTHWPVARQQRVAALAALDVIVCDEVHDADADHGDADHVRIPRMFGPEDQAAAEAAGREYIAVEPREEAYLLFTSGSTGDPKGVPISHRNIDAFLTAVLTCYDIGPGDVFSQVHEPTFDLAMFELFAAWGSGACVCAVSKLQAMNPGRCAATWGITVWTTTPSMAALSLQRGRVREGSMAGLRYSVFCGEPLPVGVSHAWQSAAPSATLDNLYGPTEATVACTRFRMAPGGVTPADLGGVETVPIGAPLPGVDCVISEEDELLLAGPQVFAGYLGAGAEPFVTRNGRRWYSTGDVVRTVADHGLVHGGRLDDQVKVNGYRLEPGEVENAIRRHAPDSSPGVVAAPLDDGTAVLCAFLAHFAGDVRSVREALGAELPAYMVPGHLWRLDALPLNANGKTDRAMLRELAVRNLAHTTGR
ncbi:D-alanine--poly(phosphoribitol) ligase [Streptomyces albus subsp. chlorinus]|uniref:AMP-binding protein n=1 Tax=Streptomyces albus TaxID=1888 RepID=UPI001D2C2C47|nr:AMP-binding protein [Streptomyces albus]NSC25207.1 D-alanine--poly(phosphoribitol) ligase [Streptomyces albus subsp. chlorinus]